MFTGSASVFGQTQKVSTGFYRVKVEQATSLGLISWHNCEQDKCGWTNDKSGMEEFVFVKIAQPNHISYRSNSGTSMIQSGGYHTWGWNYHKWDLAKTGKYLLFYTLRTYQSRHGWGKMRLRNNQFGTSDDTTRMISEYSGGNKGFSFTNHIASGVYLFDNKVAGSFCYTQFYATGSGIGTVLVVDQMHIVRGCISAFVGILISSRSHPHRFEASLNPG
jgi:hypothetical protein